jgi:hypothetical protein
MSCFICRNCYRISKEKLVSCPKCGAAESFVLPDELATSRSPLGPARPVGASTGGIMPKSYEEYLPPLPMGRGIETAKESEKKRAKKRWR